MLGAYANDGQLLHTTTLKGVNGYTFTGDILAWGAMTVAEHGVDRSGALGPLAAVGLDDLVAGAGRAGIGQLAPPRQR